MPYRTYFQDFSEGILRAKRIQKALTLRSNRGTNSFGAVDEVASLALYLCSDGAASITGANLSMDGGWTAA